MTQQKILIIEDDPGIGQSLLDGLKQHGFNAELCKTGTSGVEYAQKYSPHLILLDIRLPDGSGFDFCRQIRQMGLHQPIVVLTAQHEETDKVLGLEMGADDYVTKPFSLRELVSRIRAQLRRAYGDYASTESSVLLVADLALDQVTGQLRRGDESINLTPIEFRLLNHLARHRGQALSRAQIVEAVWGYAPDLESEKTVNVHIRRLREKIELKPEEPAIILTVPGIGYRLVG
ncbi:MAG: response regulator transcription factor [Anaerolineae bacterium]|nr:response regulator transcription factor [Anaerolineae bacterium]MCI0608813.1 response regulator transcription factor [Anaerolineae bacterium]